MVGTADSVLIRELSFISVLYREIPLYSPNVSSSVTALQDLQQEVEQHDDNEGEEEMETQ